MMPVQKEVFVRRRIRVHEVPVREVLRGRHGAEVERAEVVCDARRVRGEQALDVSPGHVAEAEWLVEVGELEVVAGDEEGREGRVDGEAREDDAVRYVGVHYDTSLLAIPSCRRHPANFRFRRGTLGRWVYSLLANAKVCTDPNECPTCTTFWNAFLTSGNVPFRNIIVSATVAATSSGAWISFSGSPWEEFPIPKRSSDRVQYPYVSVATST
jgi:hypothetical protein